MEDWRHERSGDKLKDIERMKNMWNSGARRQFYYETNEAEASVGPSDAWGPSKTLGGALQYVHMVLFFFNLKYILISILLKEDPHNVNRRPRKVWTALLR